MRLISVAFRLIHQRSPLIAVFVMANLAAAPPAKTQSGPATTTEAAAPTASAAQREDDAVLNPAEPDFVVVNLPTTLRLPLFKSNFRLTHRFAGNLRNGSLSQQASNLFGIDQGAIIGFEYRFAVATHVQAAFYRSGFDKTIQLYGKYDAVQQRQSMPVSFSPVVSIEGADNFQEKYAPAVGVAISRQVGTRLAGYVTPMWVHNTGVGTADTRDTGYLGLGARARILETTYLVAEVTPRVGGYVVGDPEYGFAIEKRVGAHVFSLTFANGASTTFRQLATGGVPGALYLGFNLTRKFF